MGTIGTSMAAYSNHFFYVGIKMFVASETFGAEKVQAFWMKVGTNVKWLYEWQNRLNFNPWQHRPPPPI